MILRRKAALLNKDDNENQEWIHLLEFAESLRRIFQQVQAINPNASPKDTTVNMGALGYLWTMINEQYPHLLTGIKWPFSSPKVSIRAPKSNDELDQLNHAALDELKRTLQEHPLEEAPPLLLRETIRQLSCEPSPSQQFTKQPHR